MTAERQSKLHAALCSHGLDALAVVAGATMRYLVGINFHALERLVVALFPADGSTPRLVLPAMEAVRVESGSAIPLHVHPWSDAEGPGAALRSAVEALVAGRAGFAPPAPLTIGVEYTAMRVMELRALERACQEVGAGLPTTPNAVPLLADLRMVKDEAELAAMQEAARMVEAALRATIAHIRPGVTERQLSAILTREIMAAGAESESFENIVASGPNSANPHHTSSDRPLQQGDLVLLDAGAMHRGYASDITRTVALGEPGTQARQIYHLVLEANRAARAATCPGASGEQIDQAARQVITAGGYGAQFVHRTGHGLGMECHEPPYIVGGSTMPLPIGTTFTIEPGIYLAGVGGVRIEDDVVVTEEGCRALTTFERELLVV
jgi:Xaa-Pro aminopeptidase